MEGLFDLAASLAHDVWPGRQLCEEHAMDHEPRDDREIPLAVWKTWHRPHGVLMTAPCPGVIWHFCPCGDRLAIYDPKVS